MYLRKFICVEKLISSYYFPNNSSSSKSKQFDLEKLNSSQPKRITIIIRQSKFFKIPILNKINTLKPKETNFQSFTWRRFLNSIILKLKKKKRTWYSSNNTVKNKKKILRTTTLIDQQIHLLRSADRASPRLYGVKPFLGEHAKLTRRKPSPAVTVSALTRSMHRNRFIDEFEAWSKGERGPGPGPDAVTRT